LFDDVHPVSIVEMTAPSTDTPGGSRRLHGVLLADMTGFSRLMGEDESRAMAALMRIREIFATVVPRHDGTLAVLVGDCFVALFDSAVSAVRAAIEIQSELAASRGALGERVRIRIGVHLGDVVRTGSEILGDSVNVAARIQAVAQPGAITVSEDVYRAVRNRVNAPFRDLGPKALKNIREKIRIYELSVDEHTVEGTAPPPARSRRPLVLAGIAIAAIVVGAAALAARHLAPGGTAPLVLTSTPASAPRSAAGEQLTVGVTGVSAVGDVPPWMQDSTRDGLNTLLSKVGRLRVFSREKIDFLRQRKGLSEIEVAEALNIEKMISGSMAMQEGNVVLEVRVVDISTGLLDASESLRAPPEGLIELQNQVAAALLTALGVQLSQAERADLFARRTRETLDGYRRLADTFGEAPEEPPKPARQDPGTLGRYWTSTAWAETASGADADVLALLEAYRAALEREDVDGVAATHLALSDEQRAGFVRYFESANDLTVALSDVEVLLDGDEALVTFTRRDVFRDRNSGKQVELEVRLSTIVVHKDGRWLMRGVKRS
jgi:class 3 adenylate cyclase/TolB-like protein